MLVSGIISMLVATEMAGNVCESEATQQLFEHPYAFQLFGIVFGYLSIARLNISFARYWEGVTQIKVMHSKWADAVMQILAFDRLDSDDVDISGDPFCAQLVRAFCQLSALATMHLHEEALPEPVMASGMKLARAVTTKLDKAGRAMIRRSSRDSSQSRGSSRGSSRDSDLDRGGSSKPAKTSPPGRRGATCRKHSGLEYGNQRVNVGEAWGGQLLAEPDEATSSEPGKPSPLQMSASTRRLINEPLFNDTEIAFFHRVPDKCHSQIQRIIRMITTRQAAGGIKAPPPIVSRVFQEMSNGILAYNNACKMKEVPVPFALVHFNALLLIFFNITSPLVVSCFTGNIAMSIITSVLVTSGFSSLWLVANELEDPFGHDPNDIPMTLYHEDFKAALRASLTSPWLQTDMWTTSRGQWREWAPPGADGRGPEGIYHGRDPVRTAVPPQIERAGRSDGDGGVAVSIADGKPGGGGPTKSSAVGFAAPNGGGGGPDESSNHARKVQVAPMPSDGGQ